LEKWFAYIYTVENMSRGSIFLDIYVKISTTITAWLGMRGAMLPLPNTSSWRCV